MWIWLCLLVCVGISIGASLKWKRRLVLWESLASIGIGVVVVMISKFCVNKGMVADTEYWGARYTEVAYEEPWDEEVPCTHDEYCERTVTRRDSEGKSYTETEEYVCGKQHNYDVDSHGPRWYGRDTNGDTFSISQGKYEALKDRWGNSTFIDMHRDYHSRDGDKYESGWDGEDKTLEPSVTTHTYENRVQASNATIFNFVDVSEEDVETYGLYDYPEVEDRYAPSLLGQAHRAESAKRILDVSNAKIGAQKQVRMWMLLYENKPMEAGLMQEALWKGGNKNEFVVCIGHDGKSITWVHVFSWTEEETMKARCQRRISELKTLDLDAASEITIEEVKAGFKRKEFADFSYLKVSPPTWAVLLVLFIVTLTSCGITALFVLNNVTEDDKPSQRLGRFKSKFTPRKWRN